MKKLYQQGDTIIEVILAMAMLALVLFSAWAITNRSSQISLAARQRTEMVNQLKEQAELIKSQWATDKNVLKPASIPTVNSVPSNPCTGFDIYNVSSKPEQATYLTVKSNGVGADNEVLELKTETKAVKGDTTQRIWVQRQDKSGYVDFYVRGCWVVTGGGSNKLDNSQFVVRLNT